MRFSHLPRFSWRWILAIAIVVPASFVLAINLLVSLPAHPPVPSAGEAIAYFAYGSNMNDRYFTRVRGVTRVSSESATLPGFAVRFNLSGIDGLEPSFANLAAEDSAIAYGILHRLPTGEFSKIVGSEGDSYDVREVTVFLPDGTSVTAKTLISTPSLDKPVLPSSRYLSYLHEAAIAYNFPKDVVERYDPKRGAYVPVVSDVFGASIQTVVWLSARL